MKSMNESAEIIAKLELIRMQRGLTQREVCERIGVSRSYIASCQRRADTGNRVTMRVLSRWAKALDCELRLVLDEPPKLSDM